MRFCLGVCCKSQNRIPQARIIDSVGEFKERNPVRRTQLRGARRWRNRVGYNRHHPQTDFVYGGEVSEAIQVRQQTFYQEAQSGRPSGVVNVDSEDPIAYVRDSTL